MNRQIFEKHMGQHVKIVLKPNFFAIDGIINRVFDDCFEFTTRQRTSYIDFDNVASIVPLE